MTGRGGGLGRVGDARQGGEVGTRYSLSEAGMIHLAAIQF